LLRYPEHTLELISSVKTPLPDDLSPVLSSSVHEFCSNGDAKGAVETLEMMRQHGMEIPSWAVEVAVRGKVLAADAVGAREELDKVQIVFVCLFV
jgi:hypothetical protein